MLTVACVGASWLTVAAQPAPAQLVEPGPVKSSVIAGWTGSEPTAVGVGIDRDEAVTAAFTSTSGTTTSLWVSERATGGDWQGTFELASGVDVGSADFAESRTGAAVLAWDSTTTIGGTRLMASVRPTTQAVWSTPVVLATDAGCVHQVSVGISNAGAATVAYVHDGGSGAIATTRTLTAGAWAGAVQHSDVPARHLELAVGSNGYATVAWTQDSAEGLDLYARRFVTGGWLPASLVSDHVAPTGLTSLAVNSSDASAMSYDVPAPSGDRTTYLARTNNDRSYPLCAPDCDNTWDSFSIMSGQGSGSNPSAVTIHESQSTLLWGTPPVQGPPGIRAARERGGSFGGSSYVSEGSDVDQLTAVSDGTYRTFATWVTHSAAGDILYARGLATPNDEPVPDPVLARLGVSSGAAVSALARYGPGVVVWADTTVQPAVLRSAQVPVSVPLFQEVDAEMVAPDQDFTTSVLVPARWSAATASPRYDVRTRQAGVRRPFGRYRTWQQRTPATSAQFRSTRGRTVCFSSRTRAGASRTAAAGAWSKERCTTVALDDTALTSRGWRRDRDDAFYGDSRLSTRTRGSILVIKNVRTRSIALMTSRRAGNGRIAVRLGGTRVGTVRLSGRHAHRVVVPVARFHRIRSGRLTLTAVDAKPVNIDGVFLSRR